MPPSNHAHPVDAVAVADARQSVLDRQDAERLVHLLNLLSDHVRARLLFALVSVNELCVGDLALALGDVTEDQVSYGLKQLRTARLVQTRRDGRVIYYRLADGFPRQLLQHCLHQLLAISNERGA